MRRRLRIRSDGLEFHFFYEKSSDSMLHIVATHGTTPDQAIAAYFQSAARYDREHDRFESIGADHAVLWNWIEEGKAIYVITCVKLAK